MSRGAQVVATATVDEGVEPAGEPRSEPVARPNLRGDLDGLLDHRPCFRIALRGYDRLQVDNYVAWVETELQVARRLADQLATRYGACSAELEVAGRLLAHSAQAREFARVSDRMTEILQLAADEAADVTAAATAEAERIVSEARTRAAAMLQQATEIKDAAAVNRDRLDAEAAAVRQRAAVAMAERLAEEEERARVGREAAAVAAASALAQARLEVDDLRRQRDEACAALRQLTDELDEALRIAAAVDVPVPAARAG